MNIFKKLNKNNFTYKRLKVEINKHLIDKGILRGQRDYQRFIILGRSRVGTNLLISYMNSHPDIFSLGEMFGNNHPQEVINIRRENPLKYLNRFCFRPYGKDIKVAGFKIFYYHPLKGESKTVWQLLKDMPDLKVIHLKRSNILRTHLSKAIAGKTDEWTITANKNIPVSNKSITLSKDDCLKAFEETKGWEKEFEQFFSNHQVLNISYEELISNPQDELEKVQQFFNLPLCKLKTSLIKQNPEPLPSLIKNYSELKEEFANTEWGRFFEE